MNSRDATRGQVAAEEIRVAGGRGHVRHHRRAPWIVDTPMIDRITGGQGLEARAGFAAMYAPSGKLTPPEHVAEVVAVLADRTSQYHSGDVLLVDAGPSVTLMP